MFNNCLNLTRLDLSNFDTSGAVDMGSMFYDTPNLKTIYVSDKFKMDNVLNTGYMFY
jgi:surface protein